MGFADGRLGKKLDDDSTMNVKPKQIQFNLLKKR